STPLCHPHAIALGPLGELYIADGTRVRKVGADGLITTYATGTVENSNNVPLFDAYGLAFDPVGNLYISDAQNDSIRKITPGGVISTVADKCGFSEADSPAAVVNFGLPLGIALDSFGNLYVADVQHSRICKITPNGLATTVIGNGFDGFSGDGGPAASAQLNQ